MRETQELASLLRDNVVDSRDLVERREFLLGEIADIMDANPDGWQPAEDLVSELTDEMDLLTEIIDEIEGYSGDTARDGITLISDDWFTEYARELAEDIGAIDKDATWPNTYIDWERAADALKIDYTSIDIAGHEWWYR